MDFMNSVKSCPPGSVNEGGRCVSIKINKPNRPKRERKERKLLKKPLNPVFTIGDIVSFGSPPAMGKPAQNPKFRGGKINNPVKQKTMQRRIK